jgi:hypothetical protein
MKPTTKMTSVSSRSRARMHREPLFRKSHIALAVALLAWLAASAPAQTGGGTREPEHVIFPVRTRVVVNGGRATVHTDTGEGLQPVKSYLDALLNAPDAPKDLLVIVSTLGQVGGPTSEIAPELEKLGATTEFESIAYPEFAFSLIGIKGSRKGQAYQVGGDGVFKSPKDSWSLNGYFATDSQRKYAFLPPDYVQFQMTPGKGTITVGDREYPASSGPKDGIHVLALNRATLETMSDDVYPLSNLPQIPNDESRLYFITTVGNPFSSPPIKAQNEWAFNVIEKLGGTYELVADAGSSDKYSLVGAVDPSSTSPTGQPLIGLQPYTAAESGSLLQGDPKPDGQIWGVLQRQRRGNFFSPIASDLYPNNNLDFYSILAKAPELFPLPLRDNPAQQKAFTDIGEKLCGNGCNPRNGYWNTNIEIPSWEATLATLNKDPDTNLDCQAADSTSPYCIIWRQLFDELTYVANIRKFETNVSDLWGKQQSNNILALLKTSQTIETELLKDERKTQASKGLVDIILKTLNLGGSVGPGPVGALVSVAGAVLSFSANLANNNAGDSEVIGVVETVEKLEDQAQVSFDAQLRELGTMFRFIYQDSGARF